MRLASLLVLPSMLVVEVASAAPHDAETRDAEAPSAPSAPQAPRVEARPHRAAALVLGGLGVAGLSAAGIFALRSVALHAAARAECTGNLCTPAGAALRGDALTAINVAGLSAAAGLASLLGGIVLAFEDPVPARRAPRRVAAGPVMLRGGAGVMLEGAWP